MVGPMVGGWRVLAAGVAAATLLVAAAAQAAPPVISGADGDRWSTPPGYVVTGGTGGAYWFWQSSTGQSGLQAATPFEVSLTRGLREGAHTLTVVQYNAPSAPGPRTERAVRSFVIDTTAPAGLELSGPATITEGEPLTVGWTGAEPGATVRWAVVVPAAGGDAGADDGDGEGQDGSTLVQGPVEATTSPAVASGLAAGAYRFIALQVDAAGNAGPVAALPVSVGPTPPAAPGALAPAPAPGPAALAPAPPVAAPRTIVRLPARNASRLRPRRAATVRVRRPILRWARGPRGTSLYNVQLFRLVSRAGTPPALRKVRSAFPRRPRLRTPPLARRGCYVWRVWPYRGGRFTARPLGVSHFCVTRATPR